MSTKVLDSKSCYIARQAEREIREALSVPTIPGLDDAALGDNLALAFLHAPNYDPDTHYRERYERHAGRYEEERKLEESSSQ